MGLGTREGGERTSSSLMKLDASMAISRSFVPLPDARADEPEDMLGVRCVLEEDRLAWRWSVQTAVGVVVSVRLALSFDSRTGAESSLDHLPSLGPSQTARTNLARQQTDMTDATAANALQVSQEEGAQGAWSSARSLEEAVRPLSSDSREAILRLAAYKSGETCTKSVIH